ncbi:DUF2459 domain-containing protein [Hyphomonas sp. WL0036]|uniref:DUF2459 domain-containing protein n=1 Tax=Hyphomonas sediminis TaxID=2866160 RepID=UPI001C8183A9|nr:DUF2459 domain-containing protein [Hyphomonas sediminis]
MQIRRIQIMKFLKGAGLTLAALLIVCFWYIAAAWISGKLPVGGRPQIHEAGQLPTYLCEAPFHTDIALPLYDPMFAWTGELKDELPTWMPPDTYVLFGWGDSVFFTSVLQPEDMTPGRVLSALAGFNQTAVRIVPVDGGSVEEYCEPIPVDTEGRAALIEHIRETFLRDNEGELHTLPTPVPGEILVKAKGRYSMFNTCNQWTAAALGKAGLPRSLFAPFAWNVTSPLQGLEEPSTEEVTLYN